VQQLQLQLLPLSPQPQPQPLLPRLLLFCGRRAAATLTQAVDVMGRLGLPVTFLHSTDSVSSRPRATSTGRPVTYPGLSSSKVSGRGARTGHR
jgi:hypothetical protein